AGIRPCWNGSSFIQEKPAIVYLIEIRKFHGLFFENKGLGGGKKALVIVARIILITMPPNARKVNGLSGKHLLPS
ncbi:MAG: hypothetical protein MUE99_10030, partial [Chitinophagaceae bacterium]|nr:hypothetical protein [Chitinophagaceae bacterium]